MDEDPLNYYDKEHSYITIPAMSPVTLLLLWEAFSILLLLLVPPILFIHHVMLLVGTASLASCGWMDLLLPHLC